MLGLLVAVFGLFAIIVVASLYISDRFLRQTIVGVLSSASLISMFASPLFIIVSQSKAKGVLLMYVVFNFVLFFSLLTDIYLQNLVIRTKSVEFMPFYLSLSTFLMSTSFLLYGIFNYDPYIYVRFLQLMFSPLLFLIFVKNSYLKLSIEITNS